MIKFYRRVCLVCAVALPLLALYRHSSIVTLMFHGLYIIPMRARRGGGHTMRVRSHTMRARGGGSRGGGTFALVGSRCFVKAS